MSDRQLYLGDGLYATFDGWAFTLTAPREHGDHYVVLEPRILQEFEAFVASCLNAKKAPPAEAGG